jgi:hypothetical protein
MSPAPAKEFSSCPHCGRNQVSAAKPDGFLVVEAANCWRIACPCGIMTRLAQTRDMLQEIWNSRSNKPWERPKISVTHPGPRGAEPGTISAAEVEGF